MKNYNAEACVGDWLEKKDPIYKSISSGRITKIENGIAYYFNSNAYDGFGGTFDAELEDCFVTVTK